MYLGEKNTSGNGPRTEQSEEYQAKEKERDRHDLEHEASSPVWKAVHKGGAYSSRHYY